MAEIRLAKLSKRFGPLEVIHEIDLDIREGEFAVLVGPSGCGKTTTLRMIAGLEEISSGEISFDGRRVDHLPPKARDIAMVFQSYALYPHMSVRSNMAFGLRMQGVGKSERVERVIRAAELLGIEKLLDRKPRELSGGQRQRVAMGRALVREPVVFLFDEPLSNLDAALRAHMRVEIKRLHQRLGTTIVYVTHDQIEAMTLADKIVVMKDGYIEQVGDPLTLYNSPANRFVAGFIGSPTMNFLSGTLVEGEVGLAAVLGEGVTIAVPEDRRPGAADLIGKPIEIGLRPEHLSEADGAAVGHDLSGIVDVVEPTGSTSLVTFTFAGGSYNAICPAEAGYRPGATIRLRADTTRLHLIDRASGAVISPTPGIRAD